MEKQYIQLANLILNAIDRLRQERYQEICQKMYNFSTRCLEMSKQGRLYEIAVAKYWHRSVEKMRQRITRNLSDFSYTFNQFRDFINLPPIEAPKISDIYAELVELEEEYGDFEFDLEERTISVFTEPITFDDIALGTFEIKLQIDQVQNLFRESPYRVIAQDPNPAAADDGVTHPHVSAERVCEGDGHAAITKALEQGRISDFFSIVTGILSTYNPDSPYVSLSDWQGYGCYDCGHTMASDDSYYCEHCMNDFCSQCSTYCQVCETSICLGCAVSCTACNEPICKKCIYECKDCHDPFCRDCLSEEYLCEDCVEQRKGTNDEEQEEYQEEQSPSPSIQPIRLGQADIHA